MSTDQNNNAGVDVRELIADVRERVVYFRELGVEALDVKLGVESADLPVATRIDPDAADKIISNLRSEISKGSEISRSKGSEISKPKEPRAPGQSRLASLPSLSNRESPSMKKPVEKADNDLTYTEIKESGTKYLAVHPPADKEPSAANPEEMTMTEFKEHLTEAAEAILKIRADIGPNCARCKLSTLGRSKVVNSVGNFNADLMFVGEAPGADEDAQGEPFVGRAGQLLTDIIEKGLEMPRSEVFIGNINRCRPPGNRAPEADESVVCKPFLLREIAVVRPKVIVVLGATAAQNLLETKVPIGKLRGHFHDYLGVKVMPTFHPAYLLRDPHKKREVWEDMKMVRDYLKVNRGQ